MQAKIWRLIFSQPFSDYYKWALFLLDDRYYINFSNRIICIVDFSYNNYCDCLSSWAYHQHSVVRDVYIIHTNNLLDIELYTIYFRMNYILFGLVRPNSMIYFELEAFGMRQNPTICVLMSKRNNQRCSTHLCSLFWNVQQQCRQYII